MRHYAKNNNNVNPQIKQVWKSVNPYPKEEICKNAEEFLQNAPHGLVAVLNELLPYHFNCRLIFVSQGKIAHKLGYTRQYVNKMIKQLVNYGFLAKKQRYDSTSLYKVTKWFDDPFVRSRLSHWFPALREAFDKKFTLLKQGKLGSKLFNNCTLRNTSDLLTCKRGYAVVEAYGMQIFGREKISPLIRVLNLTPEEQYKLSVFPDLVIEWATDKLRVAKFVRNRFNWLFKMCLDYSQQLKLSPNWALMYKLAARVIKPVTTVIKQSANRIQHTVSKVTQSLQHKEWTMKKPQENNWLASEKWKAFLNSDEGKEVQAKLGVLPLDMFDKCAQKKGDEKIETQPDGQLTIS